MVVPVLDHPFVVSRLRHDRSAPGSVAVYFGHDSIEMAHIGRAISGRDVLDLGCGGGIVGLLLVLGDPGRRATGVDICGEAVDVAHLNAALNDVAYEAVEGDLYEPFGERRFDLVLADPPAIPLPDELAFHGYGAGGPTGDALLRRMVAGAERVLRPGGRFVAITELQCPPGRIPFLDWMGRWTREADGRQARVTVLGSRRLPADYYAQLGGGLGFVAGAERLAPNPDRSAAALAEFAEAAGLRFGHWVKVDLCFDPAASSSLSLAWRGPRPSAGSRPRATLPRRELEGLIERHYGDVGSGLGADFDAFLDAATGSATIEQLARRGDLGSEDYLVDLVDALSQLGIVDVDEVSTMGGIR
jgi:SAM-dependent methyltransferase